MVPARVSMAAPVNDSRRYTLTISSASGITGLHPNPAFYVTAALSAEKVCKTNKSSSAAPTWDHSSELIIAEPTSALLFRLKCFRGRLRRIRVIGSVNIRTVDLLGRRNRDQQATLTLLDNQRQHVGFLIVQLREAVPSTLRDAVGGVELMVDLEVEEQAPNAPSSPPESVQQDNDVLESLRQVVPKIKTIVDVAPETSELRHYANIAWRVMFLAHQDAQKQSERAKALHNPLTSIVHLYSIVDVGDNFESTILDFEDVMIKIAVQTIECGIFIQQHTSSTASKPGSETQKIVENFSEALRLLREALACAPSSPVMFASAQATWDAKRQVDITALKSQLNPANMNMESREMCQPGTRMDILQDLFISLSAPNPTNNIIWLYGQAGSGKSTVLNTLAQCFSRLRRCGAFLFWDRNDAVNSDPLRVIRTLAYQLARFNPIFADTLASVVTAEPALVESSLDEQFRCLVQEPLATLAGRHDLGPVIIVLDAVDECGTRVTRQKLLDVLSTRLAKLPKMFRLVIASRDEPEIRASISRLNIDERDIQVNHDSTKSDIMRLFQRRLVPDAPAFKRFSLAPDWPGSEVITQLVDRAQGLFIWAATAIRFIESGLPKERLKKVLDVSADGEPHDGLDDLYRVRQFFTEQEVAPEALPRERMSESVAQGETDNNRRERGDEHQVSSPPSPPIREAAQETTHQNTPRRATAQVTPSPGLPSTSHAQTEVIRIRSESPRQVDRGSIDPEARWYVVYKGVKPGIARGITEAMRMKGVHISEEFDTMGRVMRVPTYQAAWALWQEKLTDREVIRFVL